MHWIFLSPHLDDAILSCGGIIWEQVRAGSQVEVWTIFAGDPPDTPLSAYAASLHARWGSGQAAPRQRRQEDALACQLVGAQFRHFDLPDCIYRRLPDGRPVVESDAALFQPYPAGENALVETLASNLNRLLPAGARLVAPLTLGGHMDHRLTRAAAERQAGSLFYYADFPYVVLNQIDLSGWIEPGWREWQQSVSAAGLAAWQAGIAAYRSQISTFWQDDGEMRTQITAYLASGQGSQHLWRRPDDD